MKKKLLIGTALSVCLLTFAMTGVLLTNNKEANEVNAYSSTSLPTTIDLNDCDETEIRNYYKSLNSLEVQDRQGTNLLKNLKTILKTGQNYFSYDSGNTVWQLYEIADRDWDKSPASSTTYGTYDSEENKIYNYVYGSSASNSKNNPFIHALYVNRDVTNQVRAWDDHQQTQWGINREHVWPKAEGFDSKGAGGARGDPMHLMAANGYANNIHSNLYYGYVDTSKSYTDCGATHTTKNGATYTWTNLSNNLKGKSLNTPVASDVEVFEPQDCDKGDIARAVFYMVARYNYFSGSDSDGIDQNNPNLDLSNYLSDWASSGFTSSTTNKGKLGLLRDLLAWHKADPVDEYEIHRNNLLYKNYTNNRNPFIDFPEWVDYIWGTVEYSGRNFISSDPSYTGYAAPNIDTINGYKVITGDDTPRVVSVSISPNSSTIDLNSEILTQKLTATVEVTNGAATTVTWSSSNTSIATVSNTGLVTAVATGSCSIIATSTYDNTKTASVSIKVVDSSSGGGSETENDFSWDLSTNSYDANPTADLVTWSHSVATMKSIKVNGTTAANNYLGGDANKRTSSRFYTGNKLEFTPATDYKITSVVMKATNSNYADALAVNSAWTNATALKTTDNNNYYVTVTPLNGSNVFYAAVGGTCGFTNVTVNYLYYDSGAAAGDLTATVSKSFKVGETITKSDITLKDGLDNVITDFEFSDYQFTYEDTPTGGETSDDVEFTIEYEDYSTTLTVSVYREETSIVIDNIDWNVTGVKTNSYTTFSGKTASSSAVYAGQCYGSSTSSLIQIRETNNNSGIVSTSSGGQVTSVVLSWHPTKNTNGRVVKVYGSHSAYSSASDLFNASTDGDLLGTIVYGTSTKLILTDSYEYIGIAASGGTAYLTNVSITYNATAENIAKYIMYEDITNQCTTKLTTVIGYFENMSKSERDDFMDTTDDYIINTARTRLIAWAANQGKVISDTEDGYIITNARYVAINLYRGEESSDSTSIFIVIVAVASVLSISSYFFIRRKSKQ